MTDATDNWEGNPFGDGPGSIPPYLAGRDGHLAKLDIALGHFVRSANGRRAYSWPILVGPRGTGKSGQRHPIFAALWGRELYEAVRTRGRCTADAAVYDAAAKSVGDHRRLFDDSYVRELAIDRPAGASRRAL